MMQKFANKYSNCFMHHSPTTIEPVQQYGTTKE